MGVILLGSAGATPEDPNYPFDSIPIPPAVPADPLVLIDENVIEITGATAENISNWNIAYNHTLSSHLALGETDSTAYRGDRGKIAYDHSQASHLSLGETAITAYRGDRGKIAYDHSQSAHLTPVSNVFEWSVNTYQPYAAAGAGRFYSGTTDPSNVNRLNYDGYLYSTRFYGDLYRSDGHLQHLTVQAGNGNGAGNDGGNLILRAGNAINADANSVPGNLYLVPGNTQATASTGYIYVGDDSSNFNQVDIQSVGSRVNISLAIKQKADGYLILGNGTGPISINGGVGFTGGAITLGNSQLVFASIDGQIRGSFGIGGHSTGYNLSVYGGPGQMVGDTNGGNLYLYGGPAWGGGTKGNIYFGKSTGSCDLNIDDTETYVVAVDPTTGLLTRRAVSSIAGTTDHGALSGLSDDDHPQYLFRTPITTASHYTGYPNRTDSTLGFVAGTRTLSVTGVNFKVWLSGVEYTIAASLSAVIPDVTGMYWAWITAPGGVPQLNVSTTSPGFGVCLTATVYWNSTTTAGIVSDERHWMGRDKWWHEYTHETIGARYHTGGTLTPTNTTFSITECEIYDEDIEHTLTLSTECKILYKDGSADWKWDLAQTNLYKLNGAAMRYNNANTLADVPNANYVAMWVFATNHTANPFTIIIGQRVDNTLANARANNTPSSVSFGALPSAEMKLLYRVIFQQGVESVTYVETADYRNVSNVPVLNYTATDHSTLSNLSFATSGHTGFAPSDAPVFTGNATFDTDSLFVDSANHRVGIGKTNPSYLLDVDGVVGATNFQLTSDERLKTKIKPLNPKYLVVTYRQFEMKSAPGEERFGVLAQELQKWYPELVSKGDDGMLSVKYIDLLVREVAYLKERVASLERFNH